MNGKTKMIAGIALALGILSIAFLAAPIQAYVNENVDGDELVEYETYRQMQTRLVSDSQLKIVLEQASQAESDTEDESLAADLEAYEIYKDVSEKLSEDAEFKEKVETKSDVTVLPLTEGDELNTSRL